MNFSPAKADMMRKRDDGTMTKLENEILAESQRVNSVELERLLGSPYNSVNPKTVLAINKTSTF